MNQQSVYLVCDSTVNTINGPEYHGRAILENGASGEALGSARSTSLEWLRKDLLSLIGDGDNYNVVDRTESPVPEAFKLQDPATFKEREIKELRAELLQAIKDRQAIEGAHTKAADEVERLRKVLQPFADAYDYAREMSKQSNLSPIDARDYFMWQTSRKLCMLDFTNAKGAIEVSKAKEQANG